MNKKEHQNIQYYLVGLIILLAVVLVLFLFYGKVGEIAMEKETVNLCRQQIEVNAIGRIGGMQLYDVDNCPTEYIAVDETEAELLKEELAKQMAACWYKLGEGKYELFDHSIEVDREPVQYCVICSVLEFESAPQELDGFLAYLGEENVPLYYAQDEFYEGKSVTYMDYFKGYKSDASLQLLYEQETVDIIDTDYDYATIFLYAKKGYIGKVWSTFGGLVAGTVVAGALVITGVGIPASIALFATSATAGGAVGYQLGSDITANWESGILLYPYDTAALKELNCEVLPASR
jgi:hypothetical protein